MSALTASQENGNSAAANAAADGAAAAAPAKPTPAAAAPPRLGGFKRPGGFKPPAFSGRAPPAAAFKPPTLGAAAAAAPAQAPARAAPAPPPRAAGFKAPAAAGARPAHAAALPPPPAPAGPEAEPWCFSVLYGKYKPGTKSRKHKAFDDGVLVIKPPARAALYAAEGKPVAQMALRGYDPATLDTGSTVLMGGWEVEVDAKLPAAKFASGEAFMRPDAAAVARALLAAPRAAAPAAGAGAAFRRPAGAGGAGARGGGGAGAAAPPRPPGVHDPAAPGAVVLNAAQWAGGAGLDAAGRPVAPVVLDPYLRRSMRPHQVEGVRFLYETTMGVAAPGRLGCILAGACGCGSGFKCVPGDSPRALSLNVPPHLTALLASIQLDDPTIPENPLQTRWASARRSRRSRSPGRSSARAPPGGRPSPRRSSSRPPR
jgi:hypothetical protein